VWDSKEQAPIHPLNQPFLDGIQFFEEIQKSLKRCFMVVQKWRSAI